MDEKRTCRHCGGSGYFSPGTCPTCHGTGCLAAPDEEALLLLVARPDRTIRRSRPRSADPGDSPAFKVACSRAYAIWRLARFNGGKDMRMPILAELELHDDPYEDEIHALADKVARAHFGTDLAAAITWGKVLGYID
jgi:hypothetical protein